MRFAKTKQHIINNNVKSGKYNIVSCKIEDFAHMMCVVYETGGECT